MTRVFSIFTHMADWLVYGVFSRDSAQPAARAVHFFVEDVSKILVLLVVVIYLIGLFRAALDTDRIRDFLQGKHRLWGYLLAAIFGAITPFCSCSSIPLFLAFTAAGIPLGITMAFLITSPMINEVAVVMLGEMLGWPFLLAYVGVGFTAGVLGGMFFDLIGAEKHLIPIERKPAKPGFTVPEGACCSKKSHKLGWRGRHAFAWSETLTILKRIWLWVVLGIGVGAIMHGYVPREWIIENLSADRWWTVPLAVAMGIPLYANASGIIPVVQSLLAKGLPVGTALAFMMSVVAASLPEFLLLKQVMKPRLLLTFFLLLLVLFTLTGLGFNWVAATWPGLFVVAG